jgi:hypothetical protein
MYGNMNYSPLKKSRSKMMLLHHIQSEQLCGNVGRYQSSPETILEDPIRRIKAGSFSAETFKLVEMDLIIVHEQDIAEAIARSASLWRTRQWN